MPHHPLFYNYVNSNTNFKNNLEHLLKDLRPSRKVSFHFLTYITLNFISSDILELASQLPS